MFSLRNLAATRYIIRNGRTYASSAKALPAVLHLKTGQSFKGKAFGAPVSVFGETVFSTSITSCKYLDTIHVFLAVNPIGSNLR